MRRVLVLALALLAGCGVDLDYVDVGRSAASVDLNLTQPVEGTDSVQVWGWIGIKATQLQFVDDSLRVLGRALRPRPGARGIDLRYDSTVAVAPGAFGAGAVGVTLPVVKGEEFFPGAFQAPVSIRSGPAKLTVPQGTDLVFPFAEGAPPSGLGPGLYGSWQLDLTRGQHILSINSSEGLLPPRIVVPAASLPADTSRILLVRVTAHRVFVVESRGDSSSVFVSTRSTVHWSVQLTP
jgi:hypothetical protein